MSVRCSLAIGPFAMRKVVRQIAPEASRATDGQNSDDCGGGSDFDSPHISVECCVWPSIMMPSPSPQETGVPLVTEEWQSLLFDDTTAVAVLVDTSTVGDDDVREGPELLSLSPLLCQMPVAPATNATVAKLPPLFVKDILSGSFGNDDELAVTTTETSASVPNVPFLDPTTRLGGSRKVSSDATNPLYIYQLIEKRKWEAAMSYLAEHPIVASIPLSGGSTIMSSGSQGNLCLHEVCKNDPPVEMVQQLIIINPSSAKTKGQWGYLPLHYACCTGANVDVVKTLIAAYQEGPFVLEDCYMLPLHLACKSGANSDVVLELLINHPEASYALDLNNLTPTDHAKRIQVDSLRDDVVQILQESDKLCATAVAARCTLQREQRKTDLFLSALTGTGTAATVPTLLDDIGQDTTTTFPSGAFSDEEVSDKMKEYCTRILSLELALGDQKSNYKKLLQAEREKAHNLDMALADERRKAADERIHLEASRKKVGNLLCRLDKVAALLRELQAEGKDFVFESRGLDTERQDVDYSFATLVTNPTSSEFPSDGSIPDYSAE